MSNTPEAALQACKNACERIINQYEGWGVQCGVDFHALLFGIETALAAPPQAAAQAEPAQPEASTLAQLNSACMSYRHDFGLLDAEEQEQMRWSAKYWLQAWRKEIAWAAQPSPPADTPAEAQGEREAFEAWARQSWPVSWNTGSGARSSGGYRDPDVDLAWDAWQARAILAANERTKP